MIDTQLVCYSYPVCF